MRKHLGAPSLKLQICCPALAYSCQRCASMPWSCDPGPRTWRVGTSVNAPHGSAALRCVSGYARLPSGFGGEYAAFCDSPRELCAQRAGVLKSPCCQQDCEVPKLKTENSCRSRRRSVAPGQLRELGCAQPPGPVCTARAGFWRDRWVPAGTAGLWRGRRSHWRSTCCF